MSQGFNSVSILDKNGVVLSISPQKIGLQGRRVGAPILQQLEGNKVQFIGPIIGPTGTALVALSHPILNKAGEHLGNVLGTIYLHENRLLLAYCQNTAIWMVHMFTLYHQKKI